MCGWSTHGPWGSLTTTEESLPKSWGKLQQAVPQPCQLTSLPPSAGPSSPAQGDRGRPSQDTLELCSPLCPFPTIAAIAAPPRFQTVSPTEGAQQDCSVPECPEPAWDNSSGLCPHCYTAEMATQGSAGLRPRGTAIALSGCAWHWLPSCNRGCQ